MQSRKTSLCTFHIHISYPSLSDTHSLCTVQIYTEDRSRERFPSDLHGARTLHKPRVCCIKVPKRRLDTYKGGDKAFYFSSYRSLKKKKKVGDY